MNLKALLAVFGVFAGCCSNAVFMELIVTYDPGAGNLFTFSQFFFIAFQGLIFTSKCFTVKRVIALRDYVTLVVMFFFANVCNNYAFNFNIPMPLSMIFRAGSLMANMVMGIVILKKRYDFWKYFSVVLITIGIIVCTIMSESQADEGVLFWMSIGVCLLTAALFVTARMGIYQETLYKKYGKHPNEALFFTHMLPLPGFLMLYQSIYDHAVIAWHSETVPVLYINIPLQVVYLIGNMLTQYLCISSVYVLTTECPSLTVTLVVTLRKFASLLFSILYFKNPFTTLHWVGTFCVFVGTIIFTEIVPNIRKSMMKSSDGENSENISLLSGTDDEAVRNSNEATHLPLVSFYKKFYSRSRQISLSSVPLAHVKYNQQPHNE